MTVVTGFAFLGRLDAGKFIDRIQHSVGRRRSSHGPSSAEIVRNLPVMRIGLLEQAGRSAGNIFDGHIVHRPAQFQQRQLLQIEPARIFGREVNLDLQGGDDPFEQLAVGFIKRIALVFRVVPAAMRE
jgi:hypothetical protein